jgi:hypothetical protein
MPLTGPGLVGLDFVPRNSWVHASSFKKIPNDLDDRIERHAVSHRNRSPSSAQEEFNIFVHLPLGAAVNRHHVRRTTVKAGMLYMPILSDTDMKAIAIVADELANEWLPAPQIFQNLEQPASIANDCPVEVICIVLPVKERNSHGLSPIGASSGRHSRRRIAERGQNSLHVSTIQLSARAAPGICLKRAGLPRCRRWRSRLSPGVSEHGHSTAPRRIWPGHQTL